ncbi:hypothetical protein FB45DRAFT_1050863 [Roridomyces roridus]|uniref:Cyclin N-terminal domain-containing protein n=1 Tax=Roridomyces roridus TaxID=1738132 RepID=A0AAD7G1T8_9AGAR|nr:hypothetical protein FB45DRAFT_1050863 [Roridomyces roridus]
MFAWSPDSSSSSPSSTLSPSSQPVHAASLVHPLNHSAELLELLDIQLSPRVVEYIVDYVTEVVDHALTIAGAYPLGRPSLAPSTLKDVRFVSNVFTRGEVTIPTILVALAYVNRARANLCIGVPQYAFERVFLGAVICAAKYTSDTCLKNVHWGICSGIFGKRDIGRIEREFLDVIDWKLGISEADVLAHHTGLMRAAIRLKVRNAAPEETPQQLRMVRLGWHHRRSSSSSTASVPALEPSSPGSSPSLSPRTPSPRAPPGLAPPDRRTKQLPDVPKDVEMHDVEPHVPSPVAVSKTYSTRIHELIRSLAMPVPDRHLPHPHPSYHSHSQSRPPSTRPLGLVV